MMVPHTHTHTHTHAHTHTRMLYILVLQNQNFLVMYRVASFDFVSVFSFVPSSLIYFLFFSYQQVYHTVHED